MRMNIQWSLVLFTVISGCGAWLFACVAIDEFRKSSSKLRFPASIIAVVLLILGGIASATHLSHVERMLEVLNHPTEGIFLEALLLGLLALDILVYVILVKRDTAPAVRKALAVLGIALAAIFTFACGKSYMMASRPAWNTYALPLSYMGTAAASGTSLYLLLCAIFKVDDDDVKKAATYTIGGAVLAIVCVLAYGLVSGVAVGEQAILYWVGVVLVGCVVPGICGAVAYRKPKKALPMGVIALAGALVGSISIRSVMWLAGTVIKDFFEVEI